MQNKIAQDRKLRHNIRRLVNPTGAALSALSPVFRKTINKLDMVDKQVRKEAEDLNYYIGMAKSFYRRKDYLTCATYLSRFHEKAKLIHHKLNTFNQGISEPHREFLLKNFKGNDKKHLFNYDPDKKIEDKHADDGLVATAGIGRAIKDWINVPSPISDLSKNFFDKKTKAMRAMEKNFSIEFYSQLKSETKEMMRTTEGFYKELLGSFDAMGSAWGARNVGGYVSEINTVNDNYKTYNEPFLKWHSRNIAPLIAKQKEVDEKAAKVKEEKAAAEAAKKELEERQRAEQEANRPYAVPDPFDRVPADKGQQIAVAPEVAPPSSGGVQPVSSPAAAPLSELPGRVPTIRQFPAPQAKHTKPRPQESGPESLSPFSFNPRPGKNLDNLDHLMEYDPELQKREIEHQRKLKADNSAHEEFLNRIEKLSDDHDIIKEILSYSEEVEKYSEEESLKLLAIAEGLIEKNAMPKKKDVAKTPKSPEPKVIKLEAPVESEPYPEADPPTELVPPAPFTQRSLPVDNGPGTRRVPDSGAPQGAKPRVDLVNTLQHDKFEPVKHDIPFGTVKKRWFDIPFLAKKRPTDIKISPATGDVLVKGIVASLRSHFLPYNHIENFPSKFVQAIRHSITEGEIESNMQCSNNRDCQIQVFSGFFLEDIDPNPSYEGLAVSFTATCRITDMGGDIIISKLTNVRIQDVAK